MSWQQIYIDGKLHHFEAEGNVIFADTPELPMRRCSRHLISHMTLQQLTYGYVVRTGGHLYSTYPLDPDTLTPLYPHASTQPQRLTLRAYKARLTNHLARLKELASRAARRFWEWC